MTSYQTPRATEAQFRHIAFLAHKLGHADPRFAVRDILGRSLSSQSRRGLTISEASDVIDALKERVETETSETA